MKKVIFIGICSFLLAACGASKATNNEPDNSNEAINEEEGNEEIDELLEAFPDTEAERIITTSVPLAEMLHTLGITPVGVPTSNNPLPADFESIDAIGSPMAPNLEIITDLEPDLILSASSLEDTLEENLDGMDFDRVYLPTDSLADLKASFQTLGTYFDKENITDEKLNEISEQEKALQERLENEDLPSVLLMIGTSDDFMVMSEESYLGSLVQTTGAENIATSELQVDSTYAPVNLENIVTADPNIIFVLASLDHGASQDMFDKEVENNEAWKNLSAYKNDNIHLLDYETFGVTSIHNIEKALTEIADYFVE